MLYSAESQEEYYRIYDQAIGPYWAAYERERKRVIWRSALSCGGVIVAVGALMFFFPKVLGKRHVWKFIAAALIASARWPLQSYRKNRKRKFIPLILKELGKKDISYSLSACLTDGELRYLVGAPANLTLVGEDGIYGTYRNVKFFFNEVTTKEFKKTYWIFPVWITCFDGWALRINGGFVEESLFSWSGMVEMGADGSIQILSEDKMLHPSFAEPLRDLLCLGNSRKARFVLEDRSLIVIIETEHDLFEGVGDRNRKTDPRVFANFAREIDVVTGAAIRLIHAIESIWEQAIEERTKDTSESLQARV